MWRQFEAEFGLRVDGQDYNPGGRHLQVSPRLNLRYDFADRLSLYASAGRFTQAQHVEEWRVAEAQARAEPAQLSVHSVLGLAGEMKSARWTVELYTKRWTRAAPYFDNALDPLSLLPDLAPDRLRIVPKESEASGLEVNLRAPLTDRLSAWSALSWSRVADELDGDDVVRSWDQPLAWSGGVAWRTPRGSVSMLAGWHRGWPRTPIRLNPDDGSISVGARNSRRWADFMSLDLRGSWTWPMARGELGVTLDITNATNRGNPCCTAFEVSSMSQFPTTEVDDWLPLLANLGFAFRWGKAD